jgi:hypothetical protein
MLLLEKECKLVETAEPNLHGAVFLYNNYEIPKEHIGSV